MPFASARFRKTSRWRASSMIWLARNMAISKYSPLMFGAYMPGTSPAMNSTCVRKVQSCDIASSISSGSSGRSAHGMSVALLHWRCTASS